MLLRRLTLCVLALALALPGVAQAQGPYINVTPGPAGRVVYTVLSPVATQTTSEETLASYTIPAGWLQPGRRMRFMAFLQGAANANSKVGRIRIGGTSGDFPCSFSSTASAPDTTFDVVLIGLTANTQMASCTGGFNASTAQGGAERYALNSANAIDVLVRVATSVQAGDVTLVGFLVEELP